MSLVRIDVARSHCKADSEDDAVLQKCIDTAEKRAARIMQRNVYADQTSLDAAVSAVPAARIAANSSYRTAMDAAAALTEPMDQADAEAAAAAALRRTKVTLSYAADGLVMDDDIYGAILLLTAHYYAHRDEVDQDNLAQIPQGAISILEHYRLPGDL